MTPIVWSASALSINSVRFHSHRWLFPQLSYQFTITDDVHLVCSQSALYNAILLSS